MRNAVINWRGFPEKRDLLTALQQRPFKYTSARS